MPEFIAPELCRIIAVPPSGGHWLHEVKFDGYRMQLRVAQHRAALRTRKGLNWTARFPEIARSCTPLPDLIADGEIVALTESGVSDFASLQNALSEKKTAGLVFYLFDLMFLQGHDLRGEPLETRKQLLEDVLNEYLRNAANIRFVSHLDAPGQSVLDAACRMNLEGVISKNRLSLYHSSRNGDWTKAKCRGGEEVVIGGWWGDRKTVRALLAGAYRNREFVYLGRIGTGFNQDNLPGLLKQLTAHEQKRPPFTDPGAIPRKNGVHWVKPEIVAEITFTTITTAGLFRQASFKGLREDKPARSVTPERQPAAKKEHVMAKERANGKCVIAGITISHPEKILWPGDAEQDALTKRDLAEYYAKAAKRLLPHIAGRPLSVVRAPDGIDGQRFFQRHALAGDKALKAMKITGDKEPYLYVDDARGLVALAQAAVLEMHPWGAKRDDPETPERIIFDIDPATDTPFSAVIAAAKDLRETLQSFGLVPYLKTTGGKGLHVVVAVKGTKAKPVTWDSVKDFAHAVCRMLEREAPERYTTNMAMKKRRGKIFLDYLRNGRSATAVAPWSPRARAHAPIAVPLSWTQLKSSLNPQSFTLATADKWLKRKDPWTNIARDARPLHAARKAAGLD